MTDHFTFIYHGDGGERLDQVITQHLAGFSRAQIRKNIEAGNARVNKKVQKPSYALKEGDQVVVHIDAPRVIAAAANPAVTITLLHEAPDYIVVEKPAGIPVHPHAAQDEPTLIDGILATYPEIASIGEDMARPGIVHRLDRGTSGIMVVARTARGFESLKKQFQDHQVIKHYLALVYGTFRTKEGTINFPIIRSHYDPTLWIAYRPKQQDQGRGRSRDALTHYAVETSFASVTLLNVVIKTGRTHQIRVHMKAIDHPVVGDTVYATRLSKTTKLPKLSRPFLHATELRFLDPATKKEVHFTSPLPSELQSYMKKLK